MVQWILAKNKSNIRITIMKKLLGELYNGGPGRSLKAELEARPEEVTEKFKELKQYIATGHERVNSLYKTLQELAEDLQLIKDKTMAMPLTMRLAAENSGLNLEKTAEEFTRLQKLSEEIEQGIKEIMRIIKGYEGTIKELETKLEKEAWIDPRIGQA